MDLAADHRTDSLPPANEAGRPAASFYFWHFYFSSPRWDLGNAVGR